MNLFNLLETTARRHPTSHAVFDGVEPHLDYRTLRNRVLRLAGALGRRGRAGDRIVVAAGNCPDYITMLFAIWAAGMVAAPLNAKLHPREMADIVADTEPVLVFASSALAEPLGTLIDRSLLVAIGGPEYEAMTSGEIVVPQDVSPDDLAWLFYTSGTTGKSKGAMLSHRNLLAMSIAHLADMEDVSPSDAIIHAAPMSHGSGLYILPYVARAARHVVPRSGGFDAAEFLTLCLRHGGCGAFMAPTMVQRLRLECEARGLPPAGLRSIIYGGGPMYLEEIRRSLATFGPIFRQLYGQGESPMTITALRHADFAGADDTVLASVGHARSGVEVRIVDDAGRQVGAEEAGEVICRGDVVMSGYWRNPAATAATIRNGWLYTGDIGTMAETGLLTLRDRSKDVIISGGSNIYPREVEEVLLTHPAIREVSVVGRRDDEWGEVVVAFVVLAPDAAADADDLDRHCLDRIARFKRPKDYVFVAALPKSAYGKVLKRELVARFAAESVPA